MRAAALIKLLRVVFGMADEGCDVPNAAYRWCERINEVFHNPESADQYEDWAADLPSAVLALIHGAKPAQDARSANRVTYDDQGNLDEIVTDAGVHLEDLGGNRWFLGASRSDGTEIRVWFRGKVTMIEDDAKEAKP